jgi:Flp pilus assembly protein protease CpaA
MMLDVLLITITLVVLILSSINDIRIREVPDWFSYGLIFAAFGVRTIFSLSLGWEILVSGILGFLVFLALAFLFYYTGQWGGGDSKLLMGMGAVIGISIPFSSNSFTLLWFLLALLLFGAIYGIIWMIVLAIIRRKIFWKNFKVSIKKKKKLHFVLIITTFIFIILAILQPYLTPLIFFPLGFLYLLVFVNVVEKSCFIKRIPASKLTEGDWLAKDVKLKNKVVMTAKTLEREDVWKLKYLEVNENLKPVTIKEGVPFVPSFLIAYIIITFFGPLLSKLFTTLFN